MPFPRRMVILTVSYLFRIFCFMGALYQVVMMSQLYFRYRVTTQMSITIDDVVIPYAVTICIRFTDILDYEGLERDTGRRYKHIRDAAVLGKYKENMTVTEIFKYTPDKKDIVSLVKYRKKGTYKVFNHSGTDIRLEKFLYSEFICYKIGLDKKHQQRMDHRFLSVTTKSPGMVYEIRFSDKLWLAHFMKVSLAPYWTWPRRSIRFPAMIRRGYRNTSTLHTKDDFVPEVNFFFVSAFRIESYFLPAPYETDCIDYKKETRHVTEIVCNHRCMEQQVLKRMGMVTFTSFIMHPVDKRLIVDLKSLSLQMRKTFFQVKEYCEKKVCRKKGCAYRITMTKTQAIRDRILRLRMTVPSLPSIRKKTVPKTDFIEYFSFVSSTISTWIGISVLWFDPQNLVTLFRKRRERRVIESMIGGKWQLSRDEGIDSLIAGLSVMNRRVCHLERDYMKLVRALRKTIR